ncbi:MAG: hypothetical protein LUD15_11420 [Bacteroides sp.]|nr:hypothetical protein [Bacteroides sp.]
MIDELLRKQLYVKSSYMIERCRIETGFNVTRRTIQLDIYAMKNDSFLGFYAPIDYYNSRKAYYYSDKEYVLNRFYHFSVEIDRLEKLILYYRDSIALIYLRELLEITARIRSAGEVSR